MVGQTGILIVLCPPEPVLLVLAAGEGCKQGSLTRFGCAEVTARGTEVLQVRSSVAELLLSRVLG